MNIRVLCFALLVATLPLPALATDTLRVRVIAQPPLAFQRNGEWVGLDVELATAVVKEAGFAVKYNDLPWSRALAELQHGNLDIIPDVSRTPDRQVFSNFIGPIRTSKRVLVVRRENLGLKINNLDELMEVSRSKGLQISIQRDVKYSDAFDKRIAEDTAFAQQFELHSKPLNLQLKKVAGGHSFGLFQDANYCIYMIKTDPEFRELAIHPFTISTDPVFLGVSKRLDPIAMQKLQVAFEKLEAVGAFAAIRTKWGDVAR